jgi:hypothetical protein
MPICEGKAAIVPPPEPPWLVEPEEQPINMTPAAEVTVLEMRHMTEPEHQVAVAELQHQARVPELPEVPRLKLRGMSKPECKTSVAEVPEVPRLERPRLSNEATVVEFEARVVQVQLRASVPREMAKTEAAVACLGWLRHHPQRRHDGCEHHHFAHRGAPSSGRAAQPTACLIRCAGS